MPSTCSFSTMPSNLISQGRIFSACAAEAMRFDANPVVLDDPHGDDCDAVFDGFGRDRLGVP